jgi:hypothetical protein
MNCLWIDIYGNRHQIEADDYQDLMNKVIELRKVLGQLPPDAVAVQTEDREVKEQIESTDCLKEEDLNEEQRESMRRQIKEREQTGRSIKYRD